MKYSLEKKDCMSSCVLAGGEKKWRRSIKKTFFLNLLRVRRMEGKCGDWVLEEKGGEKNVENVDFSLKLWRSKFEGIKLSLLEI